MEDVLVVGIAGGSGSGKTTITNHMRQQLGALATVISHDNYYRPYSEFSMEEGARINFDHPSAYETELLAEHLTALRRGETVQMPTYDFSLNDRLKETIAIAPSRVVIVEGIMVLAEPELRELMDVKVFVECDADERILRRARRDIEERGRTLESVTAQYLASVKPMHEAFVEPSKQYADLVIPTDRKDPLAMDMLLAYIRERVATSQAARA